MWFERRRDAGQVRTIIRVSSSFRVEKTSRRLFNWWIIGVEELKSRHSYLDILILFWNSPEGSSEVMAVINGEVYAI